MSAKKKLNCGQKHFLGLIAKDSGADGWTPVSKQVYPVMDAYLPAELVDRETVDEDGRGRARLTEQGKKIIYAMEWL